MCSVEPGMAGRSELALVLAAALAECVALFRPTGDAPA
jgi:hypothetical protein